MQGVNFPQYDKSLAIQSIQEYNHLIISINRTHDKWKVISFGLTLSFLYAIAVENEDLTS